MQERVELMRAMKESPSALKPLECDYTPPLELIGIYITHCTISQMVARGDLDVAAGTYLNAALGCHSFCVLHHCTHESISQHNPEHEAFENMAFRLGCLLLLFDDGYKEAHRGHHARTNEADDPDLILSHTSLPVLGDLLFHMSGQADGVPTYPHLGVPIGPTQSTILHYLGLTGLMNKTWLTSRLGLINWDNVAVKMAAFEALQVLKAHKDYDKLAHSLRATWHSSSTLSHILLSLFFARYPHKNGTLCDNEVDSFYDNSFRGQGQVDLWMMGEGAHHMHHAKSDVSYALLSKVSAEVEEQYPHIKLASRGNDDLKSLEFTEAMPPKLVESSEPSMQFPWERTKAIRESRDMLSSDPESALEKIAQTVLESALHCCTTADRALLRRIHKDMKLPKMGQNKDHPIAIAKWNETVLSDHTSELLVANSERIKAEVSNVARMVGAKMPKLASGEDIKAHYFDFFVALVDTMVSTDQQQLFWKRFSKSFPTACESVDRTALLSRLRCFLESPVPQDFRRLSPQQFTAKCRKTDRLRTRQRVSDLFFGRRSSL